MGHRRKLLEKKQTHVLMSPARSDRVVGAADLDRGRAADAALPSFSTNPPGPINASPRQSRRNHNAYLNTSNTTLSRLVLSSSTTSSLAASFSQLHLQRLRDYILVLTQPHFPTPSAKPLPTKTSYQDT
jgi:hypothetical protein